MAKSKRNYKTFERQLWKRFNVVKNKSWINRFISLFVRKDIKTSLQLVENYDDYLKKE